MRKSILRSVLVVGSWAAALAACEAEDPEQYTIIDAVPDRATPVQCTPFQIADAPAPSEIRTVSDSTWSLLDASRRLILELDDRLGIRSSTAIPAAGPGSAEHPVSIAAVGDTAWAIAARGGLRLVILSRTGRELETVPLDFIPHAVEAVGDGEFLLTAMPFGTKPPTVVVRIRGTEVQPLPVPRRRYEDMTVNALGNTALVESFPDGSAVVVHQFMAPRAFKLTPTGTVLPLPAPTPAGTREAIDFVPRAPLTDDQIPLTLAPAIALSVDPRRGDVYLLTRSGRERRGRPERTILRLTRDLEFLDGFLLDVPAVSLAYLARTGTAVVHDDQDRFYACPLPASGTRQAVNRRQDSDRRGAQ